MSDEIPISVEEAELQFGITSPHGRMPNGECRFRLTPRDGNGYIRTVAPPSGAWQKAHSHKHLRETYIVESGWIASAEKLGNDPKILLHFPGDIFTSEPSVVHNIYMTGNSVIHTVKHGGILAKDWNLDSDFIQLTQRLSEKDLISRQVLRNDMTKFGSYIDLYNNLDKLLWTVPGFLAIGATLIIGFLSSIISRQSPSVVPPILVFVVLLFSSILFYLGYVSMTRIREHHTLVGNSLALMEGSSGYFSQRRSNVERRWPISAPTQFRIIYATLSIILFIIAILMLVFPETLYSLFALTTVNSVTVSPSCS